MTRIAASSASRAEAARTDNRRTKGERIEQLQLLSKKVVDLGRRATRNEVQLERETYHCVKTPDGRFIPDFHVDLDDDIRGFTGVAIDREKGKFFINKFGDTYGPLKLPDNFRYENLFPNTRRDPAARTKGQKVLKALTKAIHDQEPEVYGKPYVMMDYDSDARTWRTPSGGKLHDASPYDKRFEYGSQSMMFDLRKKELWLEQIPGVSGQCYGPFKLPAGFKKADIAALDKLDYSSRSTTTTRSSDSYSSRSSRRSNSFSSETSGLRNFARGGEAGSSRRSSSGGEAGSARNVYFRSRGGE